MKKPLALKLAEELNEGWIQKRPGKAITDYIDEDDGTLNFLLSDPVGTEFNGHAYELARDCVNSVQRAMDGDPTRKEIYELAKAVMRKEFSHMMTELQAAADGLDVELETYRSAITN